jgi:uncharacterized protein related to proFAR isomerase
MNKKERMYEQIRKHGENLNQVFGLNKDPIKLAKKLHSLEIKANHAATCLLNTNTLNLIELNRQTGYDVKQATEDEQEAFFENILNKVDKILNFKAKNIPVYINYDARGYTLKIKDDYVKQNNLKIYTDWGGYGIIAPDFNGEV